jgi:hypothetical protein
LSALVEWKGVKYGYLLSNWNVIVAHNLDTSLLYSSGEDVCAALCGRGLWDAARKHSPNRKHETTIAQAERKQPHWQKIAHLFEIQNLPVSMRERFWLQQADEHDASLDLALLSCAKQSSESQVIWFFFGESFFTLFDCSKELEARFTIAELGGWSWSK